MVSINPYDILKDYLTNKREKKIINGLLNKYYHIITNKDNIVCKLLSIEKIGNDLILTIESEEGKVSMPFQTIDSLKEVNSEVYEFPRKLDELLLISKSRKDKRPSYLSWLLSSGKPIRDNAIKWFYEEFSLLNKQLDILILLFPHRDYQDWKNESSQIKEDFNKAINELNQVLNLVEQGKAIKISDIYTQKRLSLSSETKSPDIVIAFTGILNAGIELDDLIERVESSILSIEDTITIAKIQYSRRIF